MAVKELYYKVGIDSSNFDSSIKGMTQELRSLKGLVGNSILSPEEQKEVLTRMAKIKDEIGDIKMGTSNVDGFQLLNKAVGGISGGMVAASGAMKLFGVENEKLNKVMEVANVVMTASISLQNLKDLANLKSIAISKVQAISTGVVTAAQWAWNAAMTANPIGAIIVAITALVAGIVLLTKWLNKSKEATDEDTESKIKLKEAIKDLTDANLEADRELYLSAEERTEREKERYKISTDLQDKNIKAYQTYTDTIKKIDENKDLTDGQREKQKAAAKEEYDKLLVKNQEISNNELLNLDNK